MFADDICQLSVHILNIDLENRFFYFWEIIDVILEDEDNLVAIMDLQLVLKDWVWQECIEGVEFGLFFFPVFEEHDMAIAVIINQRLHSLLDLVLEIDLACP